MSELRPRNDGGIIYEPYEAQGLPPDVQGYIDLRKEVAAIHGLPGEIGGTALMTARITDHIESDKIDQVGAEGEQ